jgi:hypothetical protein
MTRPNCTGLSRLLYDAREVLVSTVSAILSACKGAGPRHQNRTCLTTLLWDA